MKKAHLSILGMGLVLILLFSLAGCAEPMPPVEVENNAPIDVPVTDAVSITYADSILTVTYPDGRLLHYDVGSPILVCKSYNPSSLGALSSQINDFDYLDATAFFGTYFNQSVTLKPIEKTEYEGTIQPDPFYDLYVSI